MLVLQIEFLWNGFLADKISTYWGSGLAPSRCETSTRTNDDPVSQRISAIPDIKGLIRTLGSVLFPTTEGWNVYVDTNVRIDTFVLHNQDHTVLALMAVSETATQS